MMQKAHARAVLFLFFLALTIPTFSQQKEGNRKTDATQKNASKDATDDQNKEKEKEKEEKNEDPLFKGMKYRSIGPFRGGRSLTAAGIPGDPTTYYFGSTGGGVWKSICGAHTR